MSVALLLALSAAAQEAELKFTKFEFARERVGHKVVADAVLHNGLEADLEELALIVIYFDRDLELKRSPTVLIPSLPAGKSAPVRIEVAQLPNFSRYQVYLAGGGGKWLFHGEDPLYPPVLKRKEPARLAVSEVRSTPLAAPGEAVLAFVVRNSGQLDALEPTAAISFDGGAPIRVRLAPSIAGASEDTFQVTVPDAPAHRSARAAIAWLAAEGPMQRDGDLKTLALRRFRTGRLTDGCARVDGEIGNGLAEPVAKVVLTFRVGAKSAVVALPGALKPGETRTFEAYVPDCAAVDAVSYDLAFEAAGKEAAAAAPPRLPTSKRLQTKAIEVSGPKLPPSTAPPREAPAPKEAARPELRIELRGLLVAEGYFTPKSNKYTGDVYFLRVAFLDEKGRTLKPDAEFQIALLDAKGTPWKIQRIATKREWGIDAQRINNMNAEATTIACDRKTGELWVGLVRTDGGEFTHKARIQVTVKGEGTWTWEGVEGKYLSAPRWPDVPEKK